MIKLPKKIYLNAIGKHWKVSYIHTSGKLALLELPGRKLIVYGRRYSKRAAIKLLTKWVKMKARLYLSAVVIKINKKVKVNYKKLRIHALKLEWGSYSSNKTLSFNYTLIFLPPSLVKHLIIHELCHSRYLDHSPKFWKAVAKFDKSWKRHKQTLHDGNVHLPDWVMF